MDESRRSKDRDLGVMGVLIHVAGDAANNVGVIIAGAVIWKSKSPHRYYADPAVSVAIAMMIFFSSIPLGRFNIF
jgi:zinc transporter 1